MAQSSNLISDAGTVYTTAPTVATKTKSIAPAGPIQDVVGNAELALLKLKEAAVLLALIKTVTDSTDSANLALINGVLAVLNGTGSPSTAAVTDIETVATNGANAASKAKAIAPAGPIQDYPGNLQGVVLKLRETVVLYTQIKAGTDSSDPNYTTIGDILLTLV